MANTSDKKPPIQRLVLSSDDFPARLGDRARFHAWMELFEAYIITSDATYAEDRPFDAHVALTCLEDLAFFEYRGTVNRLVRSQQQIDDSENNFFFLGVNFDAPTGLCALRGREATVAPGQMTLMSSIEPAKFFFGIEDGAQASIREVREPDPEPRHDAPTPMNGAVRFVRIPRETLSLLVQNPDDFCLHMLNPELPATQLLRRYLALVFQMCDLHEDRALTSHVNRTVTDLVALALGANRDGFELANLRGTRAARLHLVLAGIKSGFDDAQFSPQTLASQLGLSPRYVQDLLSETGATFSERVLELRLQKARRMLSDARNDRLKVSEIAYACGFSEVSYFNRSFRRRFGASPTSYRPG